MSRVGNMFRAVMGVAVVMGWGFFLAGKLAAEEKAASPATVQTAAEQIVFEDQFNKDGQLADWSGMNNVDPTRDVKGGHVLLFNDHNLTKDDADQATHLNLQNITTDSKNVNFEAKFDDFATNENCVLEVKLYTCNIPGNAVVIRRLSVGNKQKLEFMFIAEDKTKIVKSVPYPDTTGVLKLQIAGKTGELRGFYKVKPEDQYKELPGSPCTSEAFKSPEAMLTAVLMAHNFNAGGPASVKVDWAKITSPN